MKSGAVHPVYFSEVRLASDQLAGSFLLCAAGARELTCSLASSLAIRSKAAEAGFVFALRVAVQELHKRL